MQKTEYRVTDKSEWGDGPWQDEPDIVLWTDEATGMQCMVARGSNGGHLCGYVGLVPGHPYYDQSPFDVRMGLEAHGGINYGKGWALSDMRLDPAPDDTTPRWWLGFDCGHSWDFLPGQRSDMLRHGMPADVVDGLSLFSGKYGAYRPLDYVIAHVTSLAAQLQAVAQKGDAPA